MPNHGYCKNCWWWKEGICYMQPLDIGYNHTPPTSYCPDYLNRKKEDKEGTLEDWIKSCLFKQKIVYL